MMTLAEHIGSWAAGMTARDVPAVVRGIAGNALIDTLAVAVAGSSTRIGCQAFALAADAGGYRTEGHATAIGQEDMLPARHAAFTNATCAHALDMDDTCFAGIAHGSAVVLPAALAACEAVNASGLRLLEAFVAGSEVAYAVGAAAGPAFYETGWWPSGLVGGIGAAAAVARVQELDGAQTAAAIAFAAVLQNGYRAVLGTDAKPLGIGRLAEIGFEAVRLAKAGVSAPLDILERREGLLNLTIGTSAQPDRVREIGTVWRMSDPGLVLKAYPLCSCAQAAAEALHVIMQDNDLTSQDLCEVHVAVTTMIANTLVYDRPANETQAMFSLPYALACIARDGTVNATHISESSIANPELAELMERVSYYPDDGLFDIAAYPEASRIEVGTIDGRSLSRTVLTARGDPRTPMSEADLHAKFRNCVEPVFGASRASQLLKTLLRIETLPVVSALTDQLRAGS